MDAFCAVQAGRIQLIFSGKQNDSNLFYLTTKNVFGAVKTFLKMWGCQMPAFFPGCVLVSKCAVDVCSSRCGKQTGCFP